MLACTDTVTLIRHSSGSYACQTFVGVSWYDKAVVAMDGKGLAAANSVRVRIPAALLTDAAILPQTGDHIVKGAVSAVSSQADLATHNPRRVMTVGDNRRGKFPHLAVIAQ